MVMSLSSRIAKLVSVDERPEVGSVVGILVVDRLGGHVLRSPHELLKLCPVLVVGGGCEGLLV